jgi:hypothetical protein
LRALLALELDLDRESGIRDDNERRAGIYICKLMELKSKWLVGSIVFAGKVWYEVRQLSGSLVRGGLSGNVGCGHDDVIGRFVRENGQLVVF